MSPACREAAGPRPFRSARHASRTARRRSRLRTARCRSSSSRTCSLYRASSKRPVKSSAASPETRSCRTARPSSSRGVRTSWPDTPRAPSSSQNRWKQRRIAPRTSPPNSRRRIVSPSAATAACLAPDCTPAGAATWPACPPRSAYTTNARAMKREAARNTTRGMPAIRGRLGTGNPGLAAFGSGGGSPSDPPPGFPCRQIARRRKKMRSVTRVWIAMLRRRTWAAGPFRRRVRRRRKNATRKRTARVAIAAYRKGRRSIRVVEVRAVPPACGTSGTVSGPVSRFARLKARPATRTTPANRSRGTAQADRPRCESNTTVKKAAVAINGFSGPRGSIRDLDGRSGARQVREQPLPPARAGPAGEEREPDRDGGEGEQKERELGRPRGHGLVEGCRVSPRVNRATGGPGEEPGRGGQEGHDSDRREGRRARQGHDDGHLLWV